MEFGERLSALRRANNYTQEQLAECLEVSRQTVSRWESDLMFPETEKLVRIARMFGVTVDYLLTGKESVLTEAESRAKRWHYEYKSKKTLGTLPLVHINIGMGVYRAKGVIAIGNLAAGVISAGILSAGVLSVGVLAAGLLALGVFCLGLFAAGSIAVGLIAAGAIAVGFFAMGAISVGGFSFGALAVGKYLAVGDRATGNIALGMRYASGALYESASGVVNQLSFDLAVVENLLDESVPAALNGFAAWAKAICRAVC